MERLIFHVDVNSAYLSWESVKRLSEGGEDLRLIPSAVGGDPNKRTGIILAKSIPERRRVAGLNGLRRRFLSESRRGR